VNAFHIPEYRILVANPVKLPYNVCIPHSGIWNTYELEPPRCGSGVEAFGCGVQTLDLRSAW
jgi:hypothetical protein